MPEPSYKHILHLLDFATEIANRITPNSEDKGHYFMTLVYIEDILDKYGRSFVGREGINAGLTDDEAGRLRNEVTQGMDTIRATLAQLVQEYNFDETLDYKIRQFQREWRKNRP